MTAPRQAPARNANDNTASSHVVEDQSALFAALADPAIHGLPPGESVTRIDTHGAAVFLAGPFAYKVKRAVFFPFMDFSTLEKRRAACEAELAIGRGSAPALYLAVEAVVRRDGALRLVPLQEANGGAVDYAVKMRRFPADATLDKVAAQGPLSADLIAGLAAAVRASHEAAPTERERDTVAGFASYLEDNEREFAARPDLFDPERAERLARSMGHALQDLAPLLRARAQAGLVRRCHGDLHLRNIVLFEGRPLLFDAIEFNPAIATCDVLYDLAFLVMDLWQRSLFHAANALVNRYLWERPDDDFLDGLAAFPFFLAMRAAIRAKVEAAGLAHLPPDKRREAEARVRHFFEAALAFMKGAPACGPLPPSVTVPRGLLAVGGLSGSGKTTRALAWAPFLGRAPGAVIVRSDVERKRLFSTPLTQKLPQEAYTPEASAQVYAQLGRLAARILATGQSVIVDAVHARESERMDVERVARGCGMPFAGIWLEAPAETLVARVDARTGDASDADANVVRHQQTYDLGHLTWARLDAR